MNRDYVVGSLFFGTGILIFILVSIIAYQTNSNFIENEQLFRGSIMGVVLMSSGLVLNRISELSFKIKVIKN